MKTLNTIQTLAKIGKILSKIAFICALIGAGGCLVGLVCLPLGAGEILKIGGVTLYGIIGLSAGESVRTAAIALSGWLVVSAAEAVLAKFAEIYFKNELAAGTPFDPAGAKELMRLGILSIALPLGSVIVAEIVMAILTALLAVERADVSFDVGADVTRGALFMVMALMCRYGAESAQKTPELTETDGSDR